MRSSAAASPCRIASLRASSNFLISSSALLAAGDAPTAWLLCAHAELACTITIKIRIVASFIFTPISGTRSKRGPAQPILSIGSGSRYDTLRDQIGRNLVHGEIPADYECS